MKTTYFKYMFFLVTAANLLISCKTKYEPEAFINFPNENKLPESFRSYIEEKKEDFYWSFQEDTLRMKSYSEKFILSKIDTSKDYHFIVKATYWIIFNYQEMIPKLIQRITNNNEVGLEGTADLIIFERIESGDLPNIVDHGALIDDDLFKVSGRANYLLKEITGQDFGNVTMKSTKKELQELQKKWIDWLKSLDKTNTKN